MYFAGLMVFGQENGRSLHQGTGYMLAMAGLLFLALPALARAGARTVILGVVLSVITFFQPTITFAREESPVIAALHPVNALLTCRALGGADPSGYSPDPRVSTHRHRARASSGRHHLASRLDVGENWPARHGRRK